MTFTPISDSENPLVSSQPNSVQVPLNIRIGKTEKETGQVAQQTGLIGTGENSIKQQAGELKKNLKEKKIQEHSVLPTAEKAPGFFGRVKQNVINYGANWYLDKVDKKVNSEKILEEAKQAIRAAIKEPHTEQFIELQFFVSDILVKLFHENKEKWFDADTVNTLEKHKTAINKLIHANVATVFAGFAKRIQEEMAHNPLYANQSPLTTLISLVCQQVNKQVRVNLLEAEEALFTHQEALLEEIKKNTNTKSYYKELALNITHPEKRNQILLELSNYLSTNTLDLVEELTTKEKNYNSYLSQFCLDVSDDILKVLLPDGLDKITLPLLNDAIPLIGSPLKAFNVLEKLQNGLAQLLFNSYKGVKRNPIRDKAWTQDIQERIKEEKDGGLDIEPLTRTPAVFLKEFAKFFIKTDPKAIGLIERALSWATRQTLPLNDKNKKIPEVYQKEQILEQLAYHRLGGWVLNSIKEIIYTQDPTLINSSLFIDQILKSLTLGVLSKASSFAIPAKKDVLEDPFLSEQVLPEASSFAISAKKNIPEDQFLSELIRAVTEKIKDLRQENKIKDKDDEEKLINQLIVDFLQNLPIPPLFYQFIVSELTAKAEEIQEALQSANDSITEVQEVVQTATDKLKAYKEDEGGKEFLSISEKITDKFVSIILKQNVDLIDIFGLGETVEDLFKAYLPGIEINSRLIEWFKKNVGALNTSNENTPESIQLIKQGIQAVILTAIVNTIEANSKDNSKFAALLLHQIHEAFDHAFGQFTEEKRRQLADALNIQEEIEDHLARQEQLQKELNHQIQEIEGDPLKAFNEIAQLHKQLLTFSSEVKIFDFKISQNCQKLKLDLKEIKGFQEVLNFQKDRQSTLNDYKRTKNLSQTQAVEHLKKVLEAEIQKPEFDKKNLVKYQEHIFLTKELLRLLTEFTVEELTLITETLHFIQIQERSSHEESQLQKQIGEKKAEFSQKGENNPEWKEAFEKLNQILRDKEIINDLIHKNSILQEKLYEKLESFDKLSEELMSLIGLDKDGIEHLTNQKESLLSTPVFKDVIWPLIKSLKEKKIAAVLFEQLSPLLEPVIRKEENSKILSETIGKNLAQQDLFQKVCEAVSKDAVSKTSVFVTNYKPFAKKIIEVIEEREIAEDDPRIERVHKKLRQFMKNPQTRASLTAQSLVDIYQTAVGPVQDVEKATQQIRNKKFLLEGLQVVIITPREIAKELNGFIPGATDLHKLIEPQLEAVLNGKDATFEKNRELMQQFIEGALLHIFVRIVNKNFIENQSVLEVAARKLKDLDKHSINFANNLIKELTGEEGTKKQIKAFESQLKQKTENKGNQPLTHDELIAILQDVLSPTHPLKEEVRKKWEDKLRSLGPTVKKIENKLIAYALNEKILNEVFGISSERSLDTLPPVFRKIVYEKLQEQLKLQFSPMLLPIVERMQDREELNQKSGSPVLSKLCQSFTKDITTFLPILIDRYQPFARTILRSLSGNEVTHEESDELSLRIEELIKNKAKVKTYGKSLTNRDLVEAYVAVKKLNLTDAEKDLLVEQLRFTKVGEVPVKEKILAIKILPEDLLALSGEFSPSIGKNEELRAALANELQDFLHLDGNAYQALIHSDSDQPSVIEQYLEGMLLKIFLKVVNKNLPEGQKDFFVVTAENILKLVDGYYQEKRDQHLSSEELVQGLTSRLMERILGVQSETDLEGLPPLLQSMIYKLLMKKVNEVLVGVQKTVFANLDANRAELKAAKDNLQKLLGSNAAERLAEDLGNLVKDSVPYMLSQANGKKGANMIGKGVKSWFNDLKKANWNIAQLVINYISGSEINTLLERQLVNLADEQTLKTEKEQAAALVQHFILMPLNFALTKLTEEEENRKAELNQNLITNILKVVVEHFRNINGAKAKATEKGENDFTHSDFVEASHDRYVSQFRRFADEINNKLDQHLDKEQVQQLTKKIAHLVKKDRAHTQPLNKLIACKIDDMKPLSDAQKIRITESDLQDRIRQEAIVNDLHAALPEKVASYTQFAIQINEQLNLNFTPNQVEDLTKTLAELARKDVANEQLLSSQSIIKAVEAVKGSELDQQQKEILEEEGKGLNLEFRIRQEATAANRQKRDHFYLPTSKKLLKVFFPKGREDLAKILQENEDKPIPDKIIDQAWKLLKKQLLPEILPTLTELILDPETLTKVAITSLEKIKTNLDGPIVLGAPEPVDETHGELDKISGELIVELLDITRLPRWTVNLLKQRDKDGKLVYGHTLGSVLRSQFNETFIKDTLKVAFENMTSPEKREALKFNKEAERDPQKLAEAKAKKIEEMDHTLHGLTRQLVNASISYGIRRKWTEFHDRIEKKISPKGVKFKRALDKVFNFIFFKIIGTALSFLFWPVKKALQLAIYKHINLDQNRETLMDVIRKVRLGQPDTETHALYHEALLYGIAEAIEKTFKTAPNKAATSNSSV
jgi:hypothetical protein